MNNAERYEEKEETGLYYKVVDKIEFGNLNVGDKFAVSRDLEESPIYMKCLASVLINNSQGVYNAVSVQDAKVRRFRFKEYVYYVKDEYEIEGES